MTEWATSQTQTVFEFLEREDVRAAVAKITEAWNDLELLGIDLADHLELLVRRHFTRHEIDTEPLEGVDWGQLAEHYALEICGVDEDELTARRVAAGGEA